MNVFDEINQEAELQERNQVVEVPEYRVEAYQIAKVNVSQGTGRVSREVKNTIMVKNDNVQSARDRAFDIAENCGNDYIVIEKCERIVTR
jgi:hypothetical protein